MISKKKVSFFTLGCKVNQYDTQVLMESFEKKGFISASPNEEFDMCVVNTCTVTESADYQSRQIIKKIKKKNPLADILVTGCFVKNNINEVKNLRAINFYESEYSNFAQGDCISRFNNRTRAFVKVQDGCNSYCSYCKVPFVRGRSKSKNPEEAFKEVENLVKNGYKEIVLTGVNLGSYGEDLNPKTNLCLLIKKLINIDGDWRLRISSVEPIYVTSEFISLVSNEQKICKHLHVPLQSADDDILKAMNRRYSINDYTNLVSGIIKKIQGIAVTTDVIVGFPGEDEKNFKNTCRVVENIGFARVHIFSYSAREGTLASSFKNRISKDIVGSRFNILNEITKKSRIKYMNRFLCKELKVLVERDCPDFSGRKIGLSKITQGYSENYIRVYVDGFNSNHNNSNHNEFVKVKLNSIDTDRMTGYGLPVL